MLSKRNLSLLLLPFAGVPLFQWARSMPQADLHDNSPHAPDAATLALIAARTRATNAAAGRADVAKVKAGGVSGGASSSSGGSSGGGSSGRNISGVAVQGCPASRKPFHVVLTATADNYQSWQCRIMYHHWQRVRDSDPAGRCTELTGFTRLVASPGHRLAGLEGGGDGAFPSLAWSPS